MGIHCGEVVTKNAGTENRKQYSVTGNTVILAARLEQLNKEFNSSVIVSKDVIDNVKRSSLKQDEFPDESGQKTNNYKQKKTESAEYISLGYVNLKDGRLAA
ncbi:MAG: hypothetical protein IIC76_13620 [Bacteroidetes bacterium]|nr:hypothetical protein [Bacteroidota bacterium]